MSLTSRGIRFHSIRGSSTLIIIIIDRCRYGRRWPLCIFHFVAGTALFVNIFIPDKSGKNREFVEITIYVDVMM